MLMVWHYIFKMIQSYHPMSINHPGSSCLLSQGLRCHVTDKWLPLDPAVATVIWLPAKTWSSTINWYSVSTQCWVMSRYRSRVSHIKEARWQSFLSIMLTFPHFLDKLPTTLTSTSSIKTASVLAIMPSHQQNVHVFADGCKNMNDIFDNDVYSVSHMHQGFHFQNV